MPATPTDAPAAPATSTAARPRIRPGVMLSLRWLSLLIALSCAALWLLTLWAWPGISTRWFAITATHGILACEETDRDNLPHHELFALTWTPLDDLPGYHFRYRLAYLQWLPRAGSSSTLGGIATRWYLDLPLWIPIALCTPLSILSWRTHIRRRRAALTRCAHCTYDLSGLPITSPCPECGRRGR